MSDADRSDTAGENQKQPDNIGNVIEQRVDHHEGSITGLELPQPGHD